ncbi:MAG: ethanolamine utilization microcompartment shell protein EutS [Planctomycetota bacterium]|jgi:ethanolamine utilization microcompartment shell protein EutS
MKTSLELRGALVIDEMQPQFAATVAANSDGFFPVAGESAFWLEVRPGIVVNRLMDVALKSCDVKPGALLMDRSYGTMEVHGAEQGQVREAKRQVLRAAGVSADAGLKPHLLTHEVIRQVDDHQAMLINRSRSGMLLLGRDTLYTLECNPAIWVLLAANEAEKAAGVRLVGLENNGAVGRLRLAGDDASIDVAVAAIQRVLADVDGRNNKGLD